MSRSSESVTRVDIRFSNEMYEKIQQVAVKEGARTHHISQKVEVSPTVVRLVQLGLDALNGKLPDTNDNVSDMLPDKRSNILPDKNNHVSDISDKRIEAIVDRRLTELGLFPDCQTEGNSTSHSLPDKIITLPDTLPDTNVMMPDTIALLPDTLSDTDITLSGKMELLPDSLSDIKNTPSDDSSNSESIAEGVQIIPSNEIERVSGEVPTAFSFAEFHNWLGLPRATRNKANGNTAIKVASQQCKGNWAMDSSSYRFTKLT